VSPASRRDRGEGLTACLTHDGRSPPCRDKPSVAHLQQDERICIEAAIRIDYGM
jgi:hypothetical protein